MLNILTRPKSIKTSRVRTDGPSLSTPIVALVFQVGLASLLAPSTAEAWFGSSLVHKATEIVADSPHIVADTATDAFHATKEKAVAGAAHTAGFAGEAVGEVAKRTVGDTFVSSQRATRFRTIDRWHSDKDAAHFAPQFDFDTDSCLPSTAFGASGAVNPGLKPVGEITAMCRQYDFLKYSNTYYRKECHGTYCAYMYGLYFLKDQWTPTFTDVEAPWSHSGDIEHVIVWTHNGKVTHASTSAHGDYTTSPRSDLQISGDHVRFVYHKDGGRTHAFRLAKRDETRAENPTGHWVTPKLVNYEEVPCKHQRIMNDTDAWGTPSFDFWDPKFGKKLNESKPAGYPDFNKPAHSTCG